MVRPCLLVVALALTLSAAATAQLRGPDSRRAPIGSSAPTTGPRPIGAPDGGPYSGVGNPVPVSPAAEIRQSPALDPAPALTREQDQSNRLRQPHARPEPPEAPQALPGSFPPP